MLVTTTQQVPGGGYDHIQIVGPVRAHAFITFEFLRNWTSPFQDGVIYGTNKFEDKLTHTEENLRQILIGQARELGANIILDFNFSNTQVEADEGKGLLISASGTAVLVSSN